MAGVGDTITTTITIGSGSGSSGSGSGSGGGCCSSCCCSDYSIDGCTHDTLSRHSRRITDRFGGSSDRRTRVPQRT